VVLTGLVDLSGELVERFDLGEQRVQRKDLVYSSRHACCIVYELCDISNKERATDVSLVI
jgi:hypothetical protein